MTTPFQLPTAVISNGVGVNSWLTPNNILLVDGQYAVSAGTTNILQVGNFNLSIPQLSDITNFTVRVKGYRGSFNTTLQIYAVDNTSGVELSYPLAPFQSFTGTNTLFTLPSSLFGTTWTVDQANNINLKLIADGELYLDSIEIEADYVAQVTPVTPTPSSGLVVVDEFVQGQRFQLASSITDTELYAFTKSFTLPDGTPIQYADFWGTEAFITMDQGVPFAEENIRITAIQHNYQGTGLTRLSFGSINNRGLKFIYPYDHDINLCVPHNGTAEFVISNSAPFYDRFLRKNQINALVSAPIIVQDESVALTDPAHTLDFQGAGVAVVNDGGDSFKKIITIPGVGVNPPFVSSTSSSTSGASQVPTLTWSHVSSGINRLLVVQVETEAAATVSGVTYNGVALTQRVTTTNGTLKSEQWTLTAPPVGTYNIIVTVTPNAYLTCGAETFNTVDQTTPVGVTQTATGTSLTPSLVLVTGTDNSIVVDSLATGTLPIVYTAGAGQTENWHVTATPNVRQGASSIEPAGSQPDNVTMSWSITQSIPWALTALEIKGIASPVGGGVITSINADATPAQTIIAGAGISVTDNGTGGHTIATTGTGSGEVLQKTFTQAAHGFTVGQVLKSSGVDGEFALAEGDVAVNADVIGIVTSVPTVNTFVLTCQGYEIVSVLPGGAVTGDNLYLSDSVAGALTLIDPAIANVPGTISKPLGTVINDSTGLCLIFNQRGQEQQSTPVTASGLLYSAYGIQTSPGAGVTTPLLATSYTIPANTFGVGDVIRFTLGLRVSVGGSNAGIETFDISGINVKAYSSGAGSPATTYSSSFIGVITATTIEFLETTLVESNNNLLVSGVSTYIGYPTSIAFDPTIANLVEFYFQNSTGNAGANGKINTLVIEKV